MSSVKINGINDIYKYCRQYREWGTGKFWWCLKKSSLFDAQWSGDPRHRLRLHSITPPRFGCHVAVEKLSAQLKGFDRRSV